MHIKIYIKKIIIEVTTGKNGTIETRVLEMQLQTPLLVLLVLSLNLRGAYLVRAAQGKRSILAYSDASGTLVPREAEMIPSIADLTDGVYSLELAAVRPDCVAAVGSRQSRSLQNNTYV